MEKVEFLSEKWFSAVKQLAESLGDLKVPPALGELVWNIVIQMPDGKERNVSMQRMVFCAGCVADAPMTMFVEEALARKLFIDGDTQAGLLAFMSGDMRLEGDVSMITVLQTEQPSHEMNALGDKIREITAD
jgi:hypothetical protein